jgi:hypothetical protein
MSTRAEIDDLELERDLTTSLIFRSPERTYEPIPFHRPLTLADVRHFYRTGLMPMDQPQDEGDRQSDYDESTQTKDSDVSWGNRSQKTVFRQLMTLQQGQPGNYIARLGKSGEAWLYDPMRCICLVVGQQVRFLGYETGPHALMKGTSPLCYAGKDFANCHLSADPSHCVLPISCESRRLRYIGYQHVPPGRRSENTTVCHLRTGLPQRVMEVSPRDMGARRRTFGRQLGRL